MNVSAFRVFYYCAFECDYEYEKFRVKPYDIAEYQAFRNQLQRHLFNESYAPYLWEDDFFRQNTAENRKQ